MSPQRFDEISKHLFKNKENVWLSINILDALAEAQTDKIQPLIIEYIMWCRQTGRDKKEMSYTWQKQEIKILVYTAAQRTLRMTGNKEALELFKEDLRNSNAQVRTGAVLGFAELIGRKVIVPQEIDDIISKIQNDKNEDVQRVYKDLQLEIKIIQMEEEENRKSQQQDKPGDEPKNNPEDNPDKRDK
jgi:hypothetical protein